MWILTIYSPLCHQTVTNLVGTLKSIAETKEGKQACIDALPDINAHEMASFRIALAIQTITGKPSSIVSKEHSLFKTAFQQSTSACDRRHCDICRSRSTDYFYSCKECGYDVCSSCHVKRQ